MSQASTIETAAPDKLAAGRSLWSDALVRLRRDKAAMICLAVICIYTLIAIVAPFAFEGWEDSYDYDNINAGSSWQHPLGTDAFGRSILQKTLLGVSTSMTVGVMANVIAVPLGMILGALAGYFGKRIDDVIVWFYTTLASIPGIIRFIALKFTFLDKKLFAKTAFEIDLDGIVGLYVAIGIMSWIGTCRLVRAETMKLRELDYVTAARASGRNSFAILIRHIMPNVAHLGIITFSLGFVGAIMTEVTLSYLGIGVTDRPSWGRMIDSAKMDLVVGRSCEIAAAVGAMFIIVLAWNIFGDRLRDSLDPRLRNV